MEQSCLLFFAILATFASIGSTLQCFECSSTINEYCEDPFKESNVAVKTCGPGEVCLKQTSVKVLLEGQDVPLITIRRCATESICRNEPTEFQENCHTCSNNQCNSTVTVVPALSTFIVLYIFKLIFL